jgi:hypothetical protein
MSSEQTEREQDGQIEADQNENAETDHRTGTDATETYDRDALAADLRTLVTRIEELHPDPYHGYDGRVDLHATLETTVRELPETATRAEFFAVAAPLVAGLEDAHARLAPPESDDEDTQLPLSLRVVGDSIYVDGVSDEALDDLLGAQLLGVEGESLDAMTARLTDLRGSENRYFARLLLARRIESGEWFDRLLDEPAAPATATVRVRLADGSERRQSLDPVPSDTAAVRELDRSVEQPDGTGPRYRLSDDGETAVFVPGDLMVYREVVQGARQRGAGNTEAVARGAYQAHYDDQPPDDLDALVAQLPSMMETVAALVREMADAGTESLVVDLRDNSGGDSRFVFFLGYALYGWEAVVEGSDWNVALKRRTDAHREHYGVPDSERDDYATFADNPAGYDFGPRFRNREKTADERRQDLEVRLGSGAFADELEDAEHEAYYEPDQVAVVTTAGTMSSAFAGAALLSEFGADVVGVPSGQAPLSFGEAVEVELPNTGLTADVSGSLYRWTRNPDSAVLPMTRELTPTLFEERYDRAGDAALRLALEHVRGSDGDLADRSE